MYHSRDKDTKIKIKDSLPITWHQFSSATVLYLLYGYNTVRAYGCVLYCSPVKSLFLSRQFFNFFQNRTNLSGSKPTPELPHPHRPSISNLFPEPVSESANLCRGLTRRGRGEAWHRKLRTAEHVHFIRQCGEIITIPSRSIYCALAKWFLQKCGTRSIFSLFQVNCFVFFWIFLFFCFCCLFKNISL